MSEKCTPDPKPTNQPNTFQQVNKLPIEARNKVNLIHIFMVDFNFKALYIMMLVVSSRPLLTNSILQCRTVVITFRNIIAESFFSYKFWLVLITLDMCIYMHVCLC